MSWLKSKAAIAHLVLGWVMVAGGAATAAEMPASPNAALDTNSHFVELSPKQMLALAERLIAANDLERSKALLVAIDNSSTTSVDRTQVRFLLGMIAYAQGDLRGARDSYREILADHPDLTRVRLELARVLFALEDDGAAAHHFRLALADDMARPAHRTIERFLQEMRRRKAFNVRLSLGIAPDSNVNSATTDETTQLYGFLPAELSQDAQKTSGVGARANLSAVWLPKLNEAWRGEAQSSLYVTDYENASFDDVIVQSELGARRITQKGYVSTAGAYVHRWYGGDDLYRAYGGRVNMVHDFSTKYQGSAYFSLLHHDYIDNDERDGPVFTASLNLLRAFSSTRFGGAGVSVIREAARESFLKNTDYGFQLSYTQEFSGGIIAELSPRIGMRRYDGLNPLFATQRREERVGGSVSISNRKWSVHGWAPVFTYSYTNNMSNINVFDFSRHRSEVRFTRLF